MSAPGFTSILLYSSSTAASVPLPANLAQGELAINTTDGKLFYKDNLNNVQVIGWKNVPVSAGGTGTTTSTGTGSVVLNSNPGFVTNITVNGLSFGKGVGSATGLSSNIAIGSLTLSSTTTGFRNVAIGILAMGFNTTGDDNVALGYQALYQNTTGDYNVSLGYASMAQTSTGSNNVAIGPGTLLYNGDGIENTAVGSYALYSNGGADYNSALGSGALFSSTGSKNTGVGYQAGNAITTGSNNVIVGSYTGNSGGLDIRTSSNNVVLSDGQGNIRQVINSSGNVGIGVTPSTWNTTMKAVELESGSLYKSSASSIILGQNYYNDTSAANIYKTTAAASFYQQTSGLHYWGNAPSGTAGTAVTFSTRMILDNSGNLSVGTTDAQKKVTINANQSGIRLTHNFTLTDYSELTFSSGSLVGSGASIRSYRSTLTYNGNEGDLRFYTNTGAGGASSDGAERMRIYDSGGLSLGNTTDPGAANLSVTGTGAFGGSINATASSALSVEGVFTNTSAGVSSSAGIRAVGNSTGYYLLRQYSTGVTATAFGQTLANYSLLASDGASSNGLMLGSLTSDPVIFGTNNAERMRITDSGSVNITGLTASQAVATDASKNLVSVATTGTGNYVLATSPTLVTPVLGTPSSGTLTSCTGLPLTTGVTGTLLVANGGTGNTTAQAEMNRVAGATTSGQYLRGNGTNVVMATIVAGDVPTLNQNTTGSAATWTTSRNLAGNSVNGSANVAFSNKFIVQGTTDTGLSGAQFLGSLGTGIVKNTTSTGVLSIAVAGDFPTLNQNTSGTAAGLSGSQTANTVYAAPNGSAGTATFRAIVAADIPTLNQNTTGSAATWTTSRNLAGNSVNGSANVAFSNKFIVQGTTDTGLSGAQFLGSLGTGIVKNTTSTGVLSIAVAGDFPTLNQNTTGSSGSCTGNAATATSATTATNIASGAAGQIPYNTGSGATSFTAVGTTGQVLNSNGTSAPTWIDGMTPTSGTAPYFGARAFASFSTATYSNIAATYIQNNGTPGIAGTIVTLTVASHAYQVGHYIYVNATSGTAVDNLYVVTAVTATTITYTAGTSLNTSGNATIQQCSIYAGSQNVANVVYQTTGVFIINFTTPMPFANYAAMGSCGTNNGAAFSNADDNAVCFGSSAYTGIRTTQSIRGFNSPLENGSLTSVTVFA